MTTLVSRDEAGYATQQEGAANPDDGKKNNCLPTGQHPTKDVTPKLIRPQEMG